MRVTIDHQEKSVGMVFKKTYAGVFVKVEFSAEEQAIIAKEKLGPRVVLKRDWDMTMREKAEKHPEHYNSIPPPNLTVAALAKGDTYVLATIAEAKGYEAELMDGLKTLKNFLAASGTKAENKSFEL